MPITKEYKKEVNPQTLYKELKDAGVDVVSVVYDITNKKAIITLAKDADIDEIVNKHTYTAIEYEKVLSLRDEINALKNKIAELEKKLGVI